MTECRHLGRVVVLNLLQFKSNWMKQGSGAWVSAEVGKFRSGGHMWPRELFNPARRAFTFISTKTKLRELSA